MKYQSFSARQLLTMLWWKHPKLSNRDGIICDGSVRSGKTVAMTVGFVLWSMQQFDNQCFAFCGKTIESLRRNVVSLLPQWVEGEYTVTERRSENKLLIANGNRRNTYYLFGGRDESSYTLVQGMTLAGVLFDEVALMPRSFVEQALARCSVTGSKYWFNCNPEGRFHWFNQEWIIQSEQHNVMHLHFTMDDNLSLSAEIKHRYENTFTGVFYQRYILGLWVTAEGSIYRVFTENPQKFLFQKYPDNIQFASIGVDFGGNGSATAFVCTGITHGWRGVVTLDEYYQSGISNPVELEEAFVGFVRSCRKRWPVYEARCDSAEQTLIAGLRNAIISAGIAVEVCNAIKGSINDRIRFYLRLMGAGRYHCMAHCKHVQEALSTAVWSPKEQTKDVRLDDGKYNIDSLDAMEYSTEPYMETIMGVI